jgi:hypothetical protein
VPTDLRLFLDCHLQSIIEVFGGLMVDALDLLLGVLKMLLNASSKS